MAPLYRVFEIACEIWQTINICSTGTQVYCFYVIRVSNVRSGNYTSLLYTVVRGINCLAPRKWSILKRRGKEKQAVCALTANLIDKSGRRH